MSKKTFKCIYCTKEYVTKESLYNHMEKIHSDLIPNDISPAQHLFNIRNKKTHGTCIMCGEETKWNESTEKYERLCSTTCKEEYREQFKNRMMDKYGKVHLLSDPVQQRKMLENRKISGKYKWSDGREVTYTGSYELDFFKFLDLVMNFSSKDVLAPAPQTFYYQMNDGIKRFYVPDAYIPSLNLLVEIKDGGDNPNKHPKIQQVDKQKEKAKDNVMRTQKKYHYLKITNKDYSSFLNFLIELKNQDSVEENIRPIIRISEAYNVLNKYQYYMSEEVNNVYNSEYSVNNLYQSILEKVDIDNLLSIDRVFQNDTKFVTYGNEIVSECFGLPREKKFLINTENNLKKAIKNFRFCEKTKRKELARNIVNKAKDLDVKIPKINLIWNYVSPDDSLIKECCSSANEPSNDRIIDYSNIPENLEIKEMLDNAKNIYLSSDYHLFSPKRKNLTMKQKMSNINSLIMDNHNRIVNDDDVFILMGDIVNDEFDDKDKLKAYLTNLKGQKILVLGNNDLFDNEFYYECGFIHVVDSFRYKNMVFTHHPIDVKDNEYNIHGHIHFSKQYYDVKCDNHIDVCCDAHAFTPMKLDYLLDLQREGYYDGTSIYNGDFTLVNKLNEESEYEKINNFKYSMEGRTELQQIKILSHIGRHHKATVDIVKKEKDNRGGFYACYFGHIDIVNTHTPNDHTVRVKTYIIGYRGEDDLKKNEDISVKVIGAFRGEDPDDVTLVSQFIYNKHEYTQFEIMNLVYMQERHHKRQLFMYNNDINIPVFVDMDMPDHDIESEEFLSKILENNFDIDADGNVLIKLRQRSDFMAKYQTSHKLLKIYKQSNNIEGIKHQLCKLWYMIVIIETYYSKNSKMNPITKALSAKNREEALRAKSFIMNDFTQYLKFVLEVEPDFNFEQYFTGTEYHEDLLKIDPVNIITFLKRVVAALA